MQQKIVKPFIIFKYKSYRIYIENEAQIIVKQMLQILNFFLGNQL